MGEAAKTGTKETFAIAALIAAGLVVFVLLLFADRTSLNDGNAKPSVNDAPTASADEGQDLPQGTDGQVLRGLMAQYGQHPDTATARKVLQAAVNANRPDLVAAWADTLAQLAPTPAYQLVAGRAYLEAIRQPPVSANGAQRSAYARRGYTLLGSYTAVKPTDLAARTDRALLYIESGDQQVIMQGVQELRTLADENPAYTPAQLRMGIFSYQTGQYAKAEPRFRKILSTAPNHPEANYYLGLTLVGLGKPDAAQPFLQAAARAANPDLAQAAQAALRQLQAN